MKLQETTHQILKKVSELEITQLHFNSDGGSQREALIEEIIRAETQALSELERSRICSEFFSFGPLDKLIADAQLTEILVNGPQAIWVERGGRLEAYQDCFLSDITFNNAIELLQSSAGIFVNQEHPFADGDWKNFRLSLVHGSVTKSGTTLSLRRHPENPWTFEKLVDQEWAQTQHISWLRTMLKKRKNFIVVGSTGSGKTSLLNAFLQETGESCRNVIIEDASELKCPNSSSLKLLTRSEARRGEYQEIDQNQLVRRALRLRPDRIVMGEIRGAEAKDFLMALATGHEGSFASLHAQDPHQALLRLEMLIQMGAPQWSLQTIRRVIQLSLHFVVVVEKNFEGKRRLKGLYRLVALEDHGFLMEKVDSELDLQNL